MQKFLVVRFSSLGDIVLSSVVTQQLARNFSQSQITFLTKIQYESIAGLLSGVTEVISYQPGQSLLLLMSKLKRENFDCIIDLHSNWRSFWVRTLCGARRNIHYRNQRLKRMAMVAVPSLPIKQISTAQSYLDSLSDLGIAVAEVRPKLQLKPEQIKKTEEFLSDRGVAKNSFLIALAPGARWQNKRWQPERFVQVSRQMYKQHGAQTIIFGNRQESDLLSRLQKEIPGSLFALDLSYELLSALISKCRLMVSNDSGLMHIASALDVPVVAIFGPTHPKLGFAPNGNRSIVLTSSQPCSPCSLHGKSKCFQPSRFCMDNVTVDMVLEASEELLAPKRTELASRKE